MKKITFKVSSPKDCSIVSLIKEVNKISCQICIDLENGYVAVENVSNTMIDSVIELVDNYYTILRVEIDNTFEEVAEKHVTPDVEDIVDDSSNDTAEEVALESTNLVVEKQPTIVGPQSEDDLIIKKVEFENEYLEGLINQLLRTAAWAMFKMHIPEKEIGEFIYTSINEISMNYNRKDCIEFSVGDIVDCNYGIHLHGEINGGHVSAIVCNISATGMVYLVPITKVQTDLSSESYLIMNAPEDVVYENNYYRGGTALLDKAKYVRAERFHAVIGKTTPAFFEKVLYQLKSTFDFTDRLTESLEDDSDLPFFMSESTDEMDEFLAATYDADYEVVETPTVTGNTVDKGAKTKTPTKKVGGEEAALLEAIGFAFDKLDITKTVDEQVESFLTDIGMMTTEKMVTNSFIIACDIKKINYENVLLRLHELFPTVEEEIIKNILKETFKNWLDKYPSVAEKCPKISIMAILKVFAKKFAQE